MAVNMHRSRMDQEPRNWGTVEHEPDFSELPHLCRLWVLADKLAMPQLQNYAIDRICEVRVAMKSIFVNSLIYIYENTCSDSPLRLCLVDRCAICLDNKMLRAHRNFFPPHMLFDLLLQVKTRIPSYMQREQSCSAFYVPVDPAEDNQLSRLSIMILFWITDVCTRFCLH